MPTLLSPASKNFKTRKSLKSGKFDGAILYLAPHKIAGLGNVCPFSTPGCRTSCLYSAGFGVYRTVQEGRKRKTRLFFQDKKEFFRQLAVDVQSVERKALKAGKRPFVRLNGTSDIDFGAFNVYEVLPSFPLVQNIFRAFPNVQFYDYTKSIKKVLNNTEKNYTLTFSLSENNIKDAKLALEKGFNVSAVFHGDTLPKTYLGHPVVDGDKEDLQFLYPKGVIIGLRAKGQAKKDKSGFVIDLSAPVNV